MNQLPDYRLDPPDEVYPSQCDDCGEWMEGEEDGDEDGIYWSEWCPNPMCGEEDEEAS